MRNLIQKDIPKLQGKAKGDVKLDFNALIYSWNRNANM